MPIKTDWNIPLNESEIDPSILLSGSMTRLMSKPSVRQDWEIALAESRKLIQPAAIWDYVPVMDLMHDRLVMFNGAMLMGGPFIEVMAGAEQLIVGVCTSGAAISEASVSAKADGNLIRSMFYELFGAYVVGAIRQQMVDMFEKEIKAKGLHISTMLSPGESTWPISQQAALFSLVDASQIGVSLTETMMMNPMKSLSMVMGFGREPLGSEGATNCDFCTMRDSCPSSQAGKRKPEPAG